MREEPDIDCNVLVELVTDYLEGVMTADQRERFERHLRRCDGCDAYLDQMRLTIRVTGSLYQEAVPPATLDRLMTAFRGWREAR